jgi:alpha-D-ribose 1-methylphosphonate 5-triphosphate diphosphatase
LASLKLCSFEDAWKMISLNPAIATKIDKTKGSITEGKDADFLVLNSLSGNLHDIHAVFIKGKEKLKYND